MIRRGEDRTREDGADLKEVEGCIVDSSSFEYIRCFVEDRIRGEPGDQPRCHILSKAFDTSKTVTQDSLKSFKEDDETLGIWERISPLGCALRIPC